MYFVVLQLLLATDDGRVRGPHGSLGLTSGFAHTYGVRDSEKVSGVSREQIRLLKPRIEGSPRLISLAGKYGYPSAQYGYPPALVLLPSA